MGTAERLCLASTSRVCPVRLTPRELRRRASPAVGIFAPFGDAQEGATSGPYSCRSGRSGAPDTGLVCSNSHD